MRKCCRFKQDCLIQLEEQVYVVKMETNHPCSRPARGVCQAYGGRAQGPIYILYSEVNFHGSGQNIQGKRLSVGKTMGAGGHSPPVKQDICLFI